MIVNTFYATNIFNFGMMIVNMVCFILFIIIFIFLTRRPKIFMFSTFFHFWRRRRKIFSPDCIYCSFWRRRCFESRVGKKIVKPPVFEYRENTYFYTIMFTTYVTYQKLPTKNISSVNLRVTVVQYFFFFGERKK